MKCADSGEDGGIKMLLSETLLKKTSYSIKQEKTYAILVLMHQNSCLFFFEHHQCLHKMAVKFDVFLLVDT